ncbi:hypothetical protein DXG03_007799 [Asterophora parasitica]|uniref:ZW10 C-terminal helical domain-containing protein n=1 Tax=Asterophora parasitica TaxID=117018 RepID=A0A9P7GIF7_9AGAR|nr:hypothetical protein DXG03_007799 [Asterophora parasitica]
MAFPIPAHLPRRPNPQDVSSQILSKIDAATNQTLNSALASSWLSELKLTIDSTKRRIHERIQDDLPEFQRQLAASKSVQERLQTLSTNVESLSESASNPKTGLIPTLVDNLAKHAQLAQETTNARVEYETLSHLLRCRKTLKSLEGLINIGKLPDAVELCGELETLLQDTPVLLNETNVMEDVRRKFRAAQARNEEQLSEAYTRSVSCSPREFIVQPSVQVRDSDAVLSLPSILASLSANSLSNHLATLRRDLTNQFIDYILKQPAAATASSGALEHKFCLTPSPPNEDIRTSRLENLSTLFTFLSAHLLSCLPSSQTTLFKRSLSKPTTTSLLNNLLIPSLPSSYELLPPFLELLQRAIAFEDEIIVGLLGNDTNDRPVQAWADGVSGHYERQRRMQILDRSRETITAWADHSDTFVVEIDVAPASQPAPIVVPVQEEDDSPAKEDAWGFDEEPTPAVAPTEEEAISPVKEDAWGLNEDVTSSNDGNLAVEEDGWGFDDEILPDEAEAEQEPPHRDTKPVEPSSSPEIINGDDDEADPSEAWGWNEDDDADAPPAEETAWDDPWGDAPEPVPKLPKETRPPPAPSIASPKVATRLEKAAKKGKKHQIDGSDSPLTSSMAPSPVPSFEISPPESSFATSSKSPAFSRTQDVLSAPLSSAKRPSKLEVRAPPPKERYIVSGRTKRIINLVEDVLAEGNHLVASSLFSSSSASSSALGSTLLLTASGILDLYRALYPVKFVRELATAEQGMRFANDCAYLATEVERLKPLLDTQETAVLSRLEDCGSRFKVLSESWFHDVIEREQRALDNILTEGAQGFTYTAEQERYDECESAITEVLQGVRRLAQRLKSILTKSNYYTAIGMVAHATLERILTDVLALPDIPEVESHRLSELCRIFNAMEGLFVEDPAQPSFVVAYVPSWLKFSYLSELLEASMADITYLFEEGALVDFDVDELVRLVRALFADTQLRSNTILKLQGGHPVQA